MRSLMYILVSAILVMIVGSCKEEDLSVVTDNSFRVRKIIETNASGQEVYMHTFVYEKNKLMVSRTYSYTPEGEIREESRIELTYGAFEIFATQFVKVDKKWLKSQGCVFTIQDDQVCRRLISRFTSPECLECWEYQYKYSGANLEERRLYIMNNDGYRELWDNWSYLYSGNLLAEYKHYVRSGDEGLKLSYHRKYIIENNSTFGWVGGPSSESTFPSEKMDFIIERGLITSKNYSIWDEQNGSWLYFGHVDYTYDTNTNLIEEKSSSGNTAYYEYEQGKGNASLIYCEPAKSFEPDPSFKSGEVAFSLFPS